MCNVCKLAGVIGAIAAAATMHHRVVGQEGGTFQQLVDLKSVYCTVLSLPRPINTFTISASSTKVNQGKFH